MSRTVHCLYLKREAAGLDRQPYPGELGKRIFDNISAEAWRAWVGHQTMLINEYRLSTDRAQGAQVPGRGDGKIPVRRRQRQAGRVRRARADGMTGDRLARRCIAGGAALMLAAVILGAFGAHGLQSVLTPKQLASYVTGVTYQQLHSLGLVLIGVIACVTPASPWLGRAADPVPGRHRAVLGFDLRHDVRRTAVVGDGRAGGRHQLHARLGRDCGARPACPGRSRRQRVLGKLCTGPQVTRCVRSIRCLSPSMQGQPRRLQAPDRALKQRG